MKYLFASIYINNFQKEASQQRNQSIRESNTLDWQMSNISHG